MNALNVDLSLVAKYNVAGPRYTSYPPATKFTDAITWPQLVEKIATNNRTTRDLSIYFHIPFCETLCWFCGCTTVITLNHDKGMAYVEALGREVAEMAPRLNPQRKVAQLHFGGGSPTFLKPDEIRRLGEIIHKHFTFAPDIEASVEVDPRRLTRDHMVALREIGFNRASMGVQDFNPQVQEAIHRIQPREMTQQAMDWMRELGYGSINLDLIYGLPHQTPESFNETLDTVLEMKPDRLAVFSYAHVPWVKPSQKILEHKILPPPETKLQVLKLVIEKLTADNQYVYIGMDHFAKPDDELAVAQKKKQLQRNFQGYSTRAGSDIYAFGMSSISQIPEAYWQNEKELPKWQEAVDAGRAPLQRAYFVTAEDKIRRETIMRVMCDLSLDYAAMSQKLGIDFTEHFAGELAALAPFEADGLVKRTPVGFDVTDTGRLFIRNIAMCFDNTLAPVSEREAFEDDLKSVAIIGAGITGLTAAFYLKRKGIPVTVYEAGGRVGGVIQSVRRDGYLAEFGPNTILETSPKIAQLVRDAGLEMRRQDPDPKAGARYVVRYQRPIAMPDSPLGLLTTKLFTAGAKLAVLREPFVRRRVGGSEESIAEFVKRRLNQEFLDHAIDALVAGVYAGDPYKLSVQQAFPRLAQLEVRYGSLIKGQIFGARDRKKSGEVAKDRAPKFSFDEGLQVLPDTLAEQLGETVKLNTAVSKLTQTVDGWHVTTANGEVEHSAVIYCGTAHRLAELQLELSTGGRAGCPLPAARSSASDGAYGVTRPADIPDLSSFSEIRHPPVASVVLGFRREDVAHPCAGFGLLIPKVEGFKILGTIFSSSLFPNRAPAGHLTLTSYVGGERYPELALLPPEQLCELTIQDLQVLLGVQGRPTFQNVVVYPRAIPQYNVGYGRYRESMDDLENKAAGLFLAGHYRDGVSLGDSIVSGCNIVDRVEKFLAPK